jgi:flagellar M-ring protein FliF
MSSDNPASPMSAGPFAGLRPLFLLIGVAAAIAAGVAVALWSHGPNYSLLFGNLADADAAQVTQSLDQSGIPYKIENGAVLVPTENVSDARMKLAARGLPGTGGFSLLDKAPGFGVSQFMENARYQHALEEELARTIAGLQPVEGARVHLAVPRESAFVRDRKPVSASIFLKLRAGRRLEREQVAAIMNLIASSIPELSADQVTIIDSLGHLLSSPEKNSEFADRERQMEIARSLEDDYSSRIESLLTPLLGPGRVRAQVVAQIEMASTEEAREQYKPESQIVRSEQTSEDLSRNGAGATGAGVPGALTNQPPEGGAAQPPGAAPPNNAASAQTGTTQAATVPANESRQATRNYEIDRTVAYTRQPAGRLQRLSVAVLIDNLRTTAADGKVTEAALTEEQLGRINTLVRDAVGFDESRGDRVSVVNQSFLAEAIADVPPIEAAPIWERPMVMNAARLASGLIIVLLLIFMVLRPFLKNISAAAKVVIMPTPQLIPAGGSGDSAANGGPAGVAGGRSATAMAYEQQIAQARSLVAKDPARVAEVVKGWVQKDE